VPFSFVRMKKSSAFSPTVVVFLFQIFLIWMLVNLKKE